MEGEDYDTAIKMPHLNVASLTMDFYEAYPFEG